MMAFHRTITERQTTTTVASVDGINLEDLRLFLQYAEAAEIPGDTPVVCQTFSNAPGVFVNLKCVRANHSHNLASDNDQEEEST